MRVRVFQHVACAGLDSTAPWLAARQAEVVWACLYADETPPDAVDTDLLSLPGGPFVQPAEAIRAMPGWQYQEMIDLMDQVLDYLCP